jgi:acetyl-CoA carboxylase carboxyl transferase subunit beta
MLDRVTHRKALREELVTILRMLMGDSPAVRGDLPAPQPVQSPSPTPPPPAGAQAAPELTTPPKS